MAIETGQQAPDFELMDQTGQPVKLSDYRGKKSVVLVFYPFAFSGICTGELCSVRDNLPSFRNDDVETLAISTDARFTLKAFADAEGYEFPLLADFWPHGEVAQAYGVFHDDVGAAVRGTFVIDTEGVVRYAQTNGLGDARDQAEWQQALADLGVA